LKSAWAEVKTTFSGEYMNIFPWSLDVMPIYIEEAV